MCKPGWMGRNCETKRNFCQGNPCQNGGVCSNQEGSHHCACPPGFIGANCDFSGSSCDSNPCHHGGTCINNGDGTEFACLCPAGTTGRTCQQDNTNECIYDPCKNGRCIDRVGDYDCSCQPEWRGKNCDVEDQSSPGGVDKSNGRYQFVDVYEEKQKCIVNECKRKAGDNRCDEECNTHFCDYDGNDCREGINPWKNCNATSRQSPCFKVFQDGICDEACNTKECLFDGLDCDGVQPECDPLYDVYCSDRYGNDHCDPRCNNAACGWDGLDCEAASEENQIIPGQLYFILQMTVERFNDDMQKRFERYLSVTLRTNLKIKRNADGSVQVTKYEPQNISGDGSGYSFNTDLLVQGNLGIVVYLEVDNVKCETTFTEHCFDDTEDVANLVSAMLGAGKLKDDWGVYQVGAAKDASDNDGSSSSTAGIIIGVMLMIICGLVVVGMVQGKKRKATGIQWFPEGFTTGPVGFHRNDNAKKARYQANGSSKDPYNSQLNMDRWSEDDPLELAQQKNRQKHYQDLGSSDGTTITNDYDSDSRTWTQQHIHAADIKNPEILGALTPPQGEVRQHEMMTNDVNGRGPMGMTPLMIASFRGTGIDTGDIENFDDQEDSSPTIIQDLIAKGAQQTLGLDKTGETPLHLAARLARADCAKILLDNAKDDTIANGQDSTGRTPLHAAVAADAQGVFHILLKNRYTNLDAKTNDGTTPLILAARLAIEGMVEALIESQADVNIADENGKTGLHWAAAVNNVEAVNTLLKNNANRDAQDNKDETPLFLAAREGSYQAARALLDHGANREIQDHMDGLPITVAKERMHSDIVTLLEEYPSPTQMPGGMHPFNSQSMMTSGSPPGLMMINGAGSSKMQQQMRMKKPAKKSPAVDIATADNTSLMSSHTLPRQQARRQGSVKQAQGPRGGQKKNANDSSSMMLSPEHSPYEPQGYGSGSSNVNHLALSHPNLEDLMSSKQPPSYEASLARNMQGGMPGQQPLEGQYSNFTPHQMQHNRQQSMPASVASNYSNHLSPPHSNLSPQSFVQSPPHSTGAMSPPNMAMSPPQSVTMSPPQTSQYSISPPQQQQQQQSVQSSQQHLSSSASPAKSRSIQLPTSPTHLQALRGATHQRHQASFDFSNATATTTTVAAGPDMNMYNMAKHQQFLYPTPPQEQLHNNSFSPASPDQWSSASPQSNSEWSDGTVHSPPALNGNGHYSQTHLQHQQQMSQQTDAVII